MVHDGDYYMWILDKEIHRQQQANLQLEEELRQRRKQMRHDKHEVHDLTDLPRGGVRCITHVVWVEHYADAHRKLYNAIIEVLQAEARSPEVLRHVQDIQLAMSSMQQLVAMQLWWLNGQPMHIEFLS